MLPKTIVAIVFSLCSSAALAQAARPLAEPKSPQHALLVLQATATTTSAVGTEVVPVIAAEIVRIGPDGREQRLSSFVRNGSYIIFENLEPGRFRVRSTTHGATSIASYDQATADATMIEVAAGGVGFLGEFSVDLKPRRFPPGHAIENPRGTRTEEGQAKAFAMLKTSYPASPWTKALPEVSAAMASAATSGAADPASSQGGLLEPAGAQSSMIILKLSVKFTNFLGTRNVPAEVATIGFLNPEGGVQNQVRQAGRHGDYLFFANISPGKYRLVNAVYTQQPPPSAPGAAPQTGLSVSFVQRILMTFDPALAEHTVVEVKPGEIVYLGDFEANVSAKGFPVVTLVFDGASGTRTPESMAKSRAMLGDAYPKSRWTERASTALVSPPAFAFTPVAKAAATPPEPKKE